VWILVWLVGVISIAWAGLNYALPRFEHKLQTAVADSISAFNQSVDVSAQGRNITLSGNAGTEQQRNSLLAAAHRTVGVGSVQNEIVIVEASARTDALSPETTDATTSTNNELFTIGPKAVVISQTVETIIEPVEEASEVAELLKESETPVDSPDIIQLAANNVSDDVAPTKQQPTINIRVFGNILSIEGTMATSDDISGLVRAAVSSFDRDVVSNGLTLQDHIEAAGWLPSLRQIMPAMKSMDNVEINIDKEKITLSGIAPTQATHDAIISEAVQSLGNYMIVEDISIKGGPKESAAVLATAAGSATVNAPVDTTANAAAQANAEQQANIAAQAAAKAKAEEQARLSAAAEAADAEERARQKAAIAARMQAQELAKLHQESKANADEAARLQAIAIARAKASGDEAAIKAAEEENARIEAKAIADALALAKKRRKIEAEATKARAAEIARQRAEAAAKLQADELAKRKAAEEAAKARAEDLARRRALAAEEALAKQLAEQKAKSDELARVELARIEEAAQLEKAAQLEAAALAEQTKAAAAVKLTETPVTSTETPIKTAETILKPAESQLGSTRSKPTVTGVKVTSATLTPKTDGPQLNKAENEAIFQKPNDLSRLQAEIDSLDSLRILFQTHKNTLTVGSLDILDQIAEIVNRYPDSQIIIEGHTDATGNPKQNLTLSLLRATTVRDYLISRGVSPFNLRTIGLGEGVPLVPNSTPEGRAINRRIEFTFR